MVSAKGIVVDLLGRAGVGTDGREPWDLQVTDERFYGRVVAQGSLGFGDSYVDGWWQCPRIDELIHRLLSYDLEDWHSFGADYDRTLLAWRDNFDAYVASGELQRGERFNRTWRYYLLSFAGCFRTRRTIQLWQMVFSRDGRKGGYASVR